ncbi:TPA: hypothetical protein DGT35_01065 [Patescibacteria group bacterium]|nr:hypothetical protein [Patescibacteria group bacterium]
MINNEIKLAITIKIGYYFLTMRQCEICKKGSRMVGKRKLLRGHYNPTNWTRKQPNLQKTRLPDGRQLLICTRCIRTLAKKASGV